MSVWDDFIAAITDENKLLQQLIALSKEKQQQINNAPEVARIATEEQGLLTRLDQVDKQRAMLFDVVAPGQKQIEAWLVTLDEEQQDVVAPLILELAENVGTLQSLNNLNQELLAQSLSYVQFSLNVLVGGEGSPTYTRPGGNTPGKSIFDRKV